MMRVKIGLVVVGCKTLYVVYDLWMRVFNMEGIVAE